MKLVSTSCLLILFFFSARADIVHVPGDTSSIQGGIALAENGDTVLVAEDTYFENINFKGKAITVASHFYLDGDTSHISKTIIDGSQHANPDSGSVVSFVTGEDTTSVLCGFTVTGGTGTVTDLGFPGKGGGGIYLVDASAKIRDNKIINNTVINDLGTMGGGLLSGPPDYNGFNVIENNLFKSNSCYGSQILAGGGGMLLAGSARVSNNIFDNNLISSTNGEAFGAGFSCAQNMDSVIIYQNTVINNKAETFYGTDDIDAALGGGIMMFYDYTAYIRIINNIIAGNEVSGNNWTAAAGVGLEDVMGDVLFANNLVYDNFYSGSVDCHGTGICVFDNTEVKIFNNTITGNEASPYGGGLTTWRTISTVAMNNIFWGNSAGEAAPEIAVWEGNPATVVYCDVQGGWESGAGNIDADPLIINQPEFPDFSLNFNSPCIDAGIGSININSVDYSAPDYDYYGKDRPFGTGYEMGAYEWDGTDIAPTHDPIATQFMLMQNYPNPFNPKTVISYQLPVYSNVDLSIYNTLGQKVTTLVSAKQPAGTYKVEWDATGFASGVYLYQLKTNKGFVQTKKLIVLK